MQAWRRQCPHEEQCARHCHREVEPKIFHLRERAVPARRHVIAANRIGNEQQHYSREPGQCRIRDRLRADIRTGPRNPIDGSRIEFQYQQHANQHRQDHQPVQQQVTTHDGGSRPRIRRHRANLRRKIIAVGAQPSEALRFDVGASGPADEIPKLS